jgi:cell division protease FtsH
MLGGRAAEELVLGDVTTGAATDLERVTELSRAMVTRYGMSEKLGPMTFGQKEELVFLGKEIGEQRDYSDAVAQEIDGEVRGIVHEAYERAKEVLIQYRVELDRIAQRLMEVETLEASEFVALFEGAEIEPESPQTPPSTSRERPAAQPVPESQQPGLEMPPVPAPAGVSRVNDEGGANRPRPFFALRIRGSASAECCWLLPHYFLPQRPQRTLSFSMI